MANRRLPVRKIKEVLRLKYACGLSKREIARSCNVARSTVGDYVRRARAAGLGWPEAAELSTPSWKVASFPPSMYRVQFIVCRRTASTSTASCVATATLT